MWAAVTPSHGKPRHTAHGCPAEGHTSGRITEWASCPRQKYRGLGARSGRAPPLGQPQQVVSTAAFEGRAFKGANARLVPTRNRNVRHEGTAACPPSPAGTTLQLHHRPPPPPPLGSDSSRLFTGCQLLHCATLLFWRRKWQPTPVFLPGESHMGRGAWGLQSLRSQELDMT